MEEIKSDIAEEDEAEYAAEWLNPAEIPAETGFDPAETGERLNPTAPSKKSAAGAAVAAVLTAAALA